MMQTEKFSQREGGRKTWKNRGLGVVDMWVMFQKAAELYGLPFALFLALLAYVLWDKHKSEQRSNAREDRYIEVIQTLSEEVKERLTKIETKLDI